MRFVVIAQFGVGAAVLFQGGFGLFEFGLERLGQGLPVGAGRVGTLAVRGGQFDQGPDIEAVFPPGLQLGAIAVGAEHRRQRGIAAEVAEFLLFQPVQQFAFAAQAVHVLVVLEDLVGQPQHLVDVLLGVARQSFELRVFLAGGGGSGLGLGRHGHLLLQMVSTTTIVVCAMSYPACDRTPERSPWASNTSVGAQPEPITNASASWRLHGSQGRLQSPLSRRAWSQKSPYLTR